MEFIKIQKPIIVEAIEIKKEVVMNTKKGEMTAQVGDWVIVDKKKGNIIMDAEKFGKTYKKPDLPERIISEYEKKLEIIKDGKKILSPEQKVAMFRTELNYIHDENIKRFATEAVKLLPSYFFEIPASTSGKYHPDYARKKSGGGLHLHTVAAVRTATDCFEQEIWNIGEKTKDKLITSLILHDGWKSGLAEEQSDHTTYEHPMTSAEVIRTSTELYGIISDKDFNDILDDIETHMGRWNYNPNTGEILMPEPKRAPQRIMCVYDVTVSRKYLDFAFDYPITRNLPPDKPEIKDPKLCTFVKTKHILQETGTFEGYIEDEEKPVEEKPVEEKAPEEKDTEK